MMKTKNMKPKTKFYLWLMKYRKDLALFISAFIFGLLLVVIATRGFCSKCTPYSNVAINIGKLKIAWYAIFILTGIIVAGIMGSHECDRVGFSKDKLLTALIIIVPCAILTSRLYYVAFDPDKSTYTSFLSVIDIRNGGLSIHGAFIGATLLAIPISKKFGFKRLPTLDMMAIGFLIGQVFGRWGNFMNQEAHGGPIGSSNITNVLAPFIKAQMIKNGTLYHPTFLYESFFNCLFLIAVLIYRRMRLLRVGDTYSLYLFYYGVLRGLLIEPMRTDPLWVGNVKINQYPQMIVYTIVAILIMVLTRVISKKKGKPLPYYYDVANNFANARIKDRYLKMIVFDLDGTILKSEEAIKRCAKETIEQGLGINDLPLEKFSHFIEPTLYENFSNYTNDEKKIKELEKLFNKNFDKYHNKKDIKLYKGVKILLYLLKSENYKLGVITSKTRKHTDMTLKLFEIDDIFDITITSDDVKNSKPNCEAIDIIRKKYDLSNSEIIYIGDHENDIMLANNAKVKSIAIAHSPRIKEMLLLKPTKTAFNMKNIYKIVGGYNEI